MLAGLVLQNPFQMGYLGVRTLLAHKRGEPVSRRIDTGSVVATPENRNDPVVKAMLEPDLKTWLKE